MLKSVRSVTFMAVLAVTASATSAAAVQVPAYPDLYWTTVGSTGTVDDSDTANFWTHSAAISTATLRSPDASAIVRYNVTAVTGLSRDSISTAKWGLRALVRDESDSVVTVGGVPYTAGITLNLRRLSWSGSVSTLLTLRSNDFPTVSGKRDIKNRYTDVGIPACGDFNFDFDLNGYTYFVEATFVIPALTSIPLEVYAIEIFPCFPPPPA